MRRAVLLVATALVAPVAAAGVAQAATVACQQGAPVCGGSNQADEVTGTNTADNAYAKRGAGVVRAPGGAGAVQGGAGKDGAYAGHGNDGFVHGGETGQPAIPGNGPPPEPFSDRSDDVVLGGPGNDALYGGYGRGGTDQLLGGHGDDRLQTYQRGRVDELDAKLTGEVVDRGPGEDAVLFDRGVGTVFRNCEQGFPVRPGETGPGGGGEPRRVAPPLSRSG